MKFKEKNMTDNIYKDTDSIKMKQKLNSEYGQLVSSDHDVFKIEFSAEQVDDEHVSIDYKSRINCCAGFTSDMFCEFLTHLCEGDQAMTVSVMGGIEKYLDSHK